MILRPTVIPVTLLLCIGSVFGAYDGTPDLTVCDPAANTGKVGKNLPTLPKKFYAEVECNFRDQGQTVGIEEWFDYDNNRGRINDYRYDTKLTALYNYATNEMISVVPQEGEICDVQDLSTSSQKFIFGYNSTGKGSHIYSVNGAMRFGGLYPEQYLGKKRSRQIWSEHWLSCIFWPDQMATMKVDWYFADPDWLTPVSGDDDSIPVRLVVNGTIYDDPNDDYPRPFHHNYEFVNFQPGDDLPFGDEVFEVPEGTVCPGRKSTKKLPTPPKAFKFTTEVVQPGLNMIGYLNEWYDFDNKLARFDYKPLGIGGAPFGSNPMREVHDFNTGYRYVMDTILNNCTVLPLAASAFDAEKVNPQEVRIRTAKEFFDFDNTLANENFTYEGTKKVRDIDTDVWIGVKKGFPYGCDNCTASYEWYFETADWTQDSEANFESNQPVRLEIRSLQFPLVHYIYNIIDFDAKTPNFWDYNLNLCFENIQHKHFTFSFPGSYKDIVQKIGLNNFHYTLLVTFMGITGSSPLRFFRVRADISDDHDDITVRFGLFDKPPKVGDIIPSDRYNDEPTLAVAGLKLQQAVNTVDDSNGQSKFFVYLNLAATDAGTAPTQKLFANVGSFKEVKHGDRRGRNVQQIGVVTAGYSTGTLVGVILGFLALGCVLSLVIVLIVMKKKGFRLHGFMPRKFTDSQVE